MLLIAAPGCREASYTWLPPSLVHRPCAQAGGLLAMYRGLEGIIASLEAGRIWPFPELPLPLPHCLPGGVLTHLAHPCSPLPSSASSCLASLLPVSRTSFCSAVKACKSCTRSRPPSLPPTCPFALPPRPCSDEGAASC